MNEPLKIVVPHTEDWYKHLQSRIPELEQSGRQQTIWQSFFERSVYLKLLLREKLTKKEEGDYFLTFQMSLSLLDDAFLKLEREFHRRWIDTLNTDFEVQSPNQLRVICQNRGHKSSEVDVILIPQKHALVSLPSTELSTSLKDADLEVFRYFKENLFLDINLLLLALNTIIPLPHGSLYITLDNLSKSKNKKGE